MVDEKYLITDETINKLLDSTDYPFKFRGLIREIRSNPYNPQADIGSFTTLELVDELCKRDNVDCYPRDNPPKFRSITFTKETWEKSTILLINDLRQECGKK